MFHKGVMGLPWMVKSSQVMDVPTEAYTVPIGKARIAREGADVTVVTLSLSVHHSVEVAERLAADGVCDAEVIDLRSLVPLDRDAIVASVAKTGRLVVVDEDYLSFGLSGEIGATVTDRDPGLLRAPVQRVAVPDVPIPYAHGLEQAVLPGPERIEAALRKVVGA
jgi:pyruvate dehydrogenase E1 component beta subunit